MNYTRRRNKETELEISRFSSTNTEEINLFVKAGFSSSFEEQMKCLLSSIENFIEDEKLNKQTLVFTRFFVSDYANQTNIWEYLNSEEYKVFKDGAISVVQQPPVDGSKVALWAYFVNDEDITTVSRLQKNNGELLLQRPNYKHLWTTHLTTSNGSTESSKQTTNIFKQFNESLSTKGMLMKDNCIRTWLFVRDVDFNYKGVVEARKELFEEHDMTKDTHYISSTGIEGRHFDANKNVLMDAYSVGGIQKEQIKFLQALDNLNPTHEYGVTFERGTSVDYGDRRHIFISGTASIDNRGDVVHKREIDKQILRTFENIQALLADADAQMDDIAQMIVYLRDIADKEKVERFFESNYQKIPKLIVLAPVCRPEWLIEIECIAIKSVKNAEYANF